MYIELIDALRCPRQHEESWLVAAFNRMEARFVIEGRLGCPVCSASYPIADGIADFRDGPHRVSPPAGAERAMPETDETAMRIAAMLGLSRPGSVAVLHGLDGELAALVSGIASAKVIAINSTGPLAAEAENVAALFADERLPLASASVDGMMLADNGSACDWTDITRVLKTEGRLVTPVNSPLAGNFRELVRDEKYTVAEFTGPLLTLSR